MFKNDYGTIKDVRHRLKQRLKERGFNINVADSEIVIEETLASIVDIMLEKRKVVLQNFGIFSQEYRKEHLMKNIKGEIVTAPEHGEVKFRPAKKLKDTFYLWEDDI